MGRCVVSGVLHFCFLLQVISLKCHERSGSAIQENEELK